MSMTTIRRAAALACTAAIATGALGVAAPATAQSPNGSRDLANARAATAKYHDVARAEADGYIRVSHCEELPGVGGMGYHYLNPALAMDGDVDPTRPEVLLYEPAGKGGKLKLVAVEWFVPEALAPERPSVLGFDFDGPMDGHSPDMPRHYDLHLWVWKHNPNGVASAWNPAVSCEHAH